MEFNPYENARGRPGRLGGRNKKRRIASWPGSFIRMSIRATSRPRKSSKRFPRPMTFSATRKNGPSTIVWVSSPFYENGLWREGVSTSRCRSGISISKIFSATCSAPLQPAAVAVGGAFIPFFTGGGAGGGFSVRTAPGRRSLLWPAYWLPGTPCFGAEKTFDLDRPAACFRLWRAGSRSIVDPGGATSAVSCCAADRAGSLPGKP